jgi:hypothetical protein
MKMNDKEFSIGGDDLPVSVSIVRADTEIEHDYFFFFGVNRQHRETKAINSLLR